MFVTSTNQTYLANGGLQKQLNIRNGLFFVIIEYFHNNQTKKLLVKHSFFNNLGLPLFANSVHKPILLFYERFGHHNLTFDISKIN